LTLMWARRVEPNAVIFERLIPTFLIMWKNSMSFGFEPGHPPSM